MHQALNPRRWQQQQRLTVEVDDRLFSLQVPHRTHLHSLAEDGSRSSSGCGEGTGHTWNGAQVQSEAQMNVPQMTAHLAAVEGRRIRRRAHSRKHLGWQQ